MTIAVDQHLAALRAQYESAQSQISAEAEAARNRIESEVSGLMDVAGSSHRPPLIPNVPIEEPPPYVPPTGFPSASNALIPDTPLVDAVGSSGGLAFDDSPLWQS